MTQLALVVYDPNATCPRFTKFMEEIHPESGVIPFLQHWYGYGLTGCTGEQKMVIPYGTGANGKTTEIETVKALLGDYASTLPFDTLMARRSDGGPRDDLADLRGKRLVTAPETGAGKRFDEPTLKQLTGGDKVKARQLYQSYREFQPTAKIMVATNRRPVVSADPAVWRRLVLVRYAVTIPPERRDRNLGEKLRAEASGILKWLIAGCIAWQRDGLPIPPAVAEATSEYRREQDRLAGWIEARTVTAPTAMTASKALYADYGIWAEDVGEEPVSRVEFGRLLADRDGVQRARKNGHWQGLRLRREDEAGEHQGRSGAVLGTLLGKNPVREFPEVLPNLPQPPHGIEQGDAFEPEPVGGAS
jgi:putative DNA primase/helicase